MKKFAHGGDIEYFKKKYALKKVIDLSSNINFIKPKIKSNFSINSYPNYKTLYKALGKYYGIKPSQIELFSGGSSAIFELLKEDNSKKIVIYSPAYLEYKKASEVFKKDYKLINRFDNIYQNIPKKSFVVFVNPSTPDGKYYKLNKLFKIWKKAKAKVLIDESFLDFSNKPSAIKFLKKYKKLYILKSLTKFFSCAGVRVGMVISNKKNIKKLKQTQPLWKISEYDKNYILQVLKDKHYIKQTKIKTKKNKKRLKKVLFSSKFVQKVYDSKANFVLVKLNISSKKFQKILLKNQILVRRCDNFDFLNKNYVRVAIKSAKSIKRLKKVL